MDLHLNLINFVLYCFHSTLVHCLCTFFASLNEMPFLTAAIAFLTLAKLRMQLLFISKIYEPYDCKDI